jgi:hypothetical protein
MAETLSALLGYDSGLALKEVFMDLSPLGIFNRSARRLLIIKPIIPL